MKHTTVLFLSSAFLFACNMEEQNADIPPPVSIAPAGGTCDATSSIGICYEFTGEANVNDLGNQLGCALMGSEIDQSARCDYQSGDYLGACTVLGGTPDEYTLFYYESQLTPNAAAAEADCASDESSVHAQGAGTFIPAS